MPTQTQTRRITISVDTKGNPELKAIADQLGIVNKNTKSLADSFGTLQQAAAAYLGGLSIRNLASFSDEIQTLNNRYIGLAGSQEQATATLQQLFQLSRETNQSVTATSDLYLKMGLALKAANLSGQSLGDIMKTLVNSFRLSGSTAEEAYSSVSSLALSFELGSIHGRELRTVLRSNQTLALALRKEFGSGVYTAANNGFLTVSKFMEILYKNMGDINNRAKQMNATIGETSTKALEAFKLKLFEINQQLDVSGTFARGMQGVVTNMGTVVLVGAVLATATLPSLILQIYKLAASLLLLSPQVALLSGGLALGIGALAVAFGDTNISDFINDLKVGFSELKGDILGFVASIEEVRVKTLSWAGAGSEAVAAAKAQASATRQASADAHAHASALILQYNAQKELNKTQLESADSAARHAGDLSKLGKAFSPDLSPQQLLARLNSEFSAGTITIEEYNSKLQEVDLESAGKNFKNGKIDLEGYHDAFRKFSTYEFTQQLNDGKISFQEFDTAIRQLKLDKLNEELAAGKISLEDYNHSLAAVSDDFSTNGAFRTGLQDYISAIGTTTQQVAKTITSAFQGVEDVFLEFTHTGKVNFDKFAQGILDDLTRIIIRASVIQPLATGILGAFSLPATAATVPTGPGGGGSYITQAHGGVFDKGYKAFASGAVVTKPTFFGYGQNKTGLMGEAGAEAILPLSRGSGGDLGVKATVTPVNVNIINNNGSQVEQRETTGADGAKTIEVLITNKVREGFAAGKYDKAVKQAYGLNRRGT